MIAIQLDRSKVILGFNTTTTKSAYIWKEILPDLKSHGLEEILLVVTDGSSGIHKFRPSV